MREKEIEHKLKEWVEARGGKCFKWSSPSNRGVADRIVIFPGGRVFFVEVKTKVGRPTKLQEKFNREMTQMGCHSYIIRGMEGLEALMDDLGARYGL